MEIHPEKESRIAVRFSFHPRLDHVVSKRIQAVRMSSRHELLTAQTGAGMKTRKVRDVQSSGHLHMKNQLAVIVGHLRFYEKPKLSRNTKFRRRGLYLFPSAIAYGNAFLKQLLLGSIFHLARNEDLFDAWSWWARFEMGNKSLD